MLWTTTLWRLTRAASDVGLNYYGIIQLIRIRFPGQDSKRRALGHLAGRFAFTRYASGEMLVIETALPALAVEGVPFISEGPVTYADAAIADDWNRPEEDAAWAYLQ